MLERSCQQCSKRFQTRYHRSKFCGIACRDAAQPALMRKWYREHKARGPLTRRCCRYCTKAFKPTMVHQRYCNAECRVLEHLRLQAERNGVTRHYACTVCEQPGHRAPSCPTIDAPIERKASPDLEVEQHLNTPCSSCLTTAWLYRVRKPYLGRMLCHRCLLIELQQRLGSVPGTLEAA